MLKYIASLILTGLMIALILGGVIVMGTIWISLILNLAHVFGWLWW